MARNNRPIAALLAVLVALNLIAWAWAWNAFAGRPALIGTALLAWVFGLRHAVDADHLAAIDNVVRKLMQSGQRPVMVGLFFSLGHSTVVILAAIGVAFATYSTSDLLAAFKAVGGGAGTCLSAAFLLLIALANLVNLRNVWGIFQGLRRGAPSEPHRDLPAGGGVLARALRPVMRVITRSWHMFPLGFLFGLGFDTATEIGLLGISATQAANGLSPWQVLAFPALFTAGMALVDTADGAVMVGAYGWAFVDPLRKLWYNMTITAASVVVAVLIGGLELLALAADRLGLNGGFWGLVGDLNADLADFGFIVIGTFLLCWGASALFYRRLRIGEMAPDRGPS